MKTLPIIFFFSLVLIVLFLAHFFVFASISRFLSLGLLPRRVLGLVFVLLTLSFVGSAAYSHYVNNAFSETLYLLSSSWLGLFSNLFWSVIVFWPIFLFCENRLKPEQLLSVMATLLVAAAAFTLFGYFNAKDIYYRQETVKIKNLPEWWKGKKIVQLSDVHLNNIHDERFLRPIVDRINSEKVEAAFLTGDIFDGMDGALISQVEPLKYLQAGKGMYFISGNHETYMGLDRATATLEKVGVQILLDKKVTIEGLEVAGIRFPERDGLRRDLVKEVETLDLRTPSVLLYHDPRQVEELSRTGRVSLMLSGHTHNGQLWPYSYIVRMIYGIYGIGRHQVGEMIQFTTTGAGTWGPPMRTTGRPEVTFFTLE
jgi:predicted MPP superfamily phosphohydrolase